MNSSDEVADVRSSMAAMVLLGAAVLNPAAHCASSEAQTKVRSEMLVSTAWLQDHLGDRDLVVVQVGRSRSDYDAAHIPGARFLPLDELVEQHSDSLNDLPAVESLQALFESLGVDDNARVVLYGASGGLLAARAYFTLDYLGHGDRAALLDGGMEKWRAEGRPTNAQPCHAHPAHFTPHVQSDVLITTPRMRAITAERADSGSQYVLLDSRPPREFDGIVASEAVPKTGHIPGAHSLYWKTLLQSEAAPSLLDTAELKQAFDRVAGSDHKTLVITYCRTGMQSSFTYFVAKYLGYRAAMYDGSVYQWVNGAGYDLVVSSHKSE